jgi:ribosome-binding factor A
MDKIRLSKINQFIKEELGEIIFRELELPRDILATITRVESSNNLSSAKVYISVFPEEKYQEVIEELNKRIFQVQKKLNKKMELRIVPRIKFVKEEKTEEADKIEKILEEIKKN